MKAAWTMLMIVALWGGIASDAGAQWKRANERTTTPLERDQESFFGKSIWLWVGVPFVVMIVLAYTRRKPKRTIVQMTPDEFQKAVIEAGAPTLVHFYREWSIGDQVMIAQVERIARAAQGLFEVAWIDLQHYPEMMKAYGNFEGPALLLFAGGERIFQCEGVFDEADVRRDAVDALERWERKQKRQAADAR